MPDTDYNDPEITFPRLQVRLFTINDTMYFADVWLWEKAGGPRQGIVKAKAVGTMKEAHAFLAEMAGKYSAACDPEDITIGV